MVPVTGFQQFRQVFMNQLLLQGDGAGGNHHSLFQRPGYGQCSDQVTNGFACTSTRFHHCNPLIRVRIGKRIGHSGNHLLLSQSWIEIAGL